MKLNTLRCARLSALILAELVLFSACGRENSESKTATEDGESAAESCESREASRESCEFSCESYAISSQCDSSKSENPVEDAFAHAFRGGIYDGRDEVRLVALGDSIAQGFLLPDPRRQAYPALICKGLRSGLAGTDVVYSNYAVAGNETSDLLALLENRAADLEKADVVTLCIGANNVLHRFTSSLTQLYTLLGIGFGETAAEVSGAADASARAEAAGELIDRLNAFLESAEFSDAVGAGLRSAEKDLALILAKIKARAPEALVLVMNVYSPYHGMNFTLPYIERTVKLGDLSDKWVSRLNAAIEKATLTADCVLVDVFGAFRERGGLVNAAVSILPPRFSFDPHPNPAGHREIARLHLEKLAAYGQ